MRRSLALFVVSLLALVPLGAQDAAATEDPTAAAEAAGDPASASDAADVASAAAAALEEELAASLERIAELEARIGELEGTLSSLEADAGAWETTRDYYETRIADLEQYASEVENERARSEALRGEEVAGRAQDAEDALLVQDDLFAAIETAQQERDDLQARVDELELELAMYAVAGLGEESGEGDAAGLEVARAAWELEGGIDGGRFPILLVDGFSDAKARIGTWKLGPATAEQTNPTEFFSRLDIPLGQGEGRAYLYRFTARATGKGWVGLGIHFFASNVRSRRGYGEGRSLLVWLTRDQAVRKTDATWLQLYRSFDDVNMERVFDARLEEAIGEEHAVELVYDSKTGYLVVALDGRIGAVYRAFFGFEEGVGVSLRTLGAGVVFGDFQVRATKAR